MKDFQKWVIAALAGAVLGFGAQSVLAVGFRKARNAEFLAEALSSLRQARQAVQAHKQAKGSWPRGVEALSKAGFLSAEDPPFERLRGSARWVSRYDGQGGFLYVSTTGKVYLNTDLKREKFSPADWKRLKESDALLPGTLY